MNTGHGSSTLYLKRLIDKKAVRQRRGSVSVEQYKEEGGILGGEAMKQAQWFLSSHSNFFLTVLPHITAHL